MDPLATNYSVLNNYVYNDKSTTLTFLDFLSAPARGILGGKTITVFTQEKKDPWDILTRVSIAALSILLVPIAVVSFGSLAIKHLICSKDFVIKSISEHKARQEFNKEVKENNFEKAFQIYHEHPEIGSDKMAYDALKKAINCFIILHSESFDQITDSILVPISHLSTDDAIAEITCAIKFYLSEYTLLQKTLPSSITRLIEGRFKNGNAEDLYRCYENIIFNALPMDKMGFKKQDEDHLKYLFQMSIADNIITQYLSLRSQSLEADGKTGSSSGEDLRRKLAEHVCRNLKFEQKFIYTSFIDRELMNEINCNVEALRDILIKTDSFNKALRKIDAEHVNLKQQCSPIHWSQIQSLISESLFTQEPTIAEDELFFQDLENAYGEIKKLLAILEAKKDNRLAQEIQKQSYDLREKFYSNYSHFIKDGEPFVSNKALRLKILNKFLEHFESICNLMKSEIVLHQD